MAETVRIVFEADIGDLQSGLAQAAAGVSATTAAMRASAGEVTITFAALQQAYAAGVGQRLAAVRGESDAELAITRAGDRAQTDMRSCST